ncbi:MAG: hypothetical protein CVV23_16980 [Ignavibacteriae bacterium HGW-Ignavibacteriae-2]|jgi:hypothetical protein|nr:MAG: hypothetical protein CVV23_16980 [Ignavibacteriae bacterium HGW-Ignavibacteriae-2]
MTNIKRFFIEVGIINPVKNIFKEKIFCWILIFLINSTVYCQFTSSKHFNDALVDISEFIASDNFAELKASLPPFKLADSLYNNSLQAGNSNISETLLALTFATLPYHEMPIHVPLFNNRVNIPLPSTSVELFKRKLNNLPSNIFYSSDEYERDKDKLTHFFGNAFLTYNIRIFNLSKFMSIFVELFEYTFKVEGAVDFRDLLIDILGEIFGNLLYENKNTQPSEALMFYYLFYTTINI